VKRELTIPLLPAASGQDGFGLLEAIVAIAILAGTLVAIFTLVGGVLSSANRIGQSNASVEVTLNAIEAMTAVNPMIQESGQIDLGPYKVHWRSATTTSVTDGTGYPAGISNYRVALYESEVEVAEASGQILTTFKLRQVGYRRVRDTLAPVSEDAK
jgi:general secretion pathway protein I